VKVAIGTVGCIGIIALSIWALFVLRPGCGDDIQTTNIPNSPWQVLTKVSSCSALDGVVTVVARNRLTNQETEIAFMDEESVPTVEALSPRIVQLTFENLVDIVRSRNSFANVSVLYKFVPKDDPEARRRYQFWTRHPNDPHAIRWQQNHFETASH
jgi:hypothetical protein